jgi:tripartite-type tricarboxylate transporter receptor subunit TctC
MKYLLLAMLALAHTVNAQSYPDKPVRVIVAFTPGGTSDLFARALQPRLAEGLGQPVIIENRPGAGGSVAEALLAKAPADGYTMMFTADTYSTNPHLFKNLGYDQARDLLPVSMLARVPHVLLVHPSVPAATLQEFVAYVRARQGQISYGSPGSGGGTHLYTEIFNGMAGIDMRHVPYKGGAPAMNDLIGGHVQALLISITLAAPQVRGSKVRAMGVGGDKRALLLPQVPTFAEGGYPEFSPHTWTGLFLPAGTPPAIVQRVHQEHARALRFPEVEARFRELGAEIVMNSPAQFAAQLRAENEQLGNIIRERKISAD